MMRFQHKNAKTGAHIKISLRANLALHSALKLTRLLPRCPAATLLLGECSWGFGCVLSSSHFIIPVSNSLGPPLSAAGGPSLCCWGSLARVLLPVCPLAAQMQKLLSTEMGPSKLPDGKVDSLRSDFNGIGILSQAGQLRTI